MKISSKGRYGLRFLLDLAMHQGEGNVTLQDVARRQSISEKYLWQVVSPLRKARLIRAVTGPGGGYSLARPPAEVTLHDVLALLEGVNGLVTCPEHSPSATGNEEVARAIWQDVDEQLAAILRGITLETMLERQRTANRRDATLYTI